MPPSKSKSALKAYSALFLTQKGDVEIGTLQGEATGLTLASVQAHYKKRQNLEPIGTYAYKSYTLFLFGSTVGKEGQENQHQLPPPYDMTPFFADILLIASKDEDSFSNPVPFQMDEYESFYTKSFGGYTSDNSEEDALVEVDAEVDEVPLEDGKEFIVEEEDDEDEDDDEDDDDADDAADAADAAEGRMPRRRDRAPLHPYASAGARMRPRVRLYVWEEESLSVKCMTIYRPTYTRFMDHGRHRLTGHQCLYIYL